MSVSCSLFVDRSSQIQHLNDSGRSQIEVFTDDLYQFFIAHFTGSCGIYVDGSRMCNTDRIGQLDLALISQTCCYDVLCNVTCCVSCGTVNLCAVFSGESSAAVTTVSTVSIYDNLSSGQTTVTVWSADYKSSGFTKNLVSASTISAGRTSSKTYFLISSWICSCVTSGSCCVDSTTASRRYAFPLSSYSTVT